MQPKVSITMPCYNAERYLHESIRSVLGQSLGDIEVICVNDGSTDGTLGILQTYAAQDKRVHIIDKPNTGYGHSVNVGFDAAQGEYLGILEPDDFMEPNMLGVLFNAAYSYEADVVKCNIWNHRSVPEACDEFYEDYLFSDCNRVIAPCSELQFFMTMPAVWAGLYRSEFIRSNGIRFHETPGASYQDASFAFEVLLRAGRMVAIHDALIHYRVDNDSSSVHDPSKMYCVCDEYERMFAMLEDVQDEELAASLRKMLVQRKFSTYWWNYKRLEPGLGQQFLYRVQQEFQMHDEADEINWSFPEKMAGQEYFLRAIIDDPVFFHLTQHDESDTPRFLRTIRRYYSAGGLKYIFKLFRNKIGHSA